MTAIEETATAARRILQPDWRDRIRHRHIGRRHAGHEVEDACPCEQAPCGLVPEGANPDCPEHSTAHTMRQGHPATNCPGSTP